MYNDGTAILNAWEGLTVDHKGILATESCLRLVPGNQDCKDIGNWDQCPWSPYRERVTYDF